MLAAASGFDIEPLLHYFNIEVSAQSKEVLPYVGAFMVHKALTPVRVALTAAVTPIAQPYLAPLVRRIVERW